MSLRGISASLLGNPQEPTLKMSARGVMWVKLIMIRLKWGDLTAVVVRPIEHQVT